MTARAAGGGAPAGRTLGDAPFWTRPLAEVRAALDVPSDGLDEATAGARRARFGPNTLGPRRRRSVVAEYLRRFGNPLVLLLLVASVVSAAMGEGTGSAVIVAIVLASVTLEFAQEHRAGRAAERLRAGIALRALAWRGGRWLRLPAEDLVPGDRVRLAAGDLVPADGRVLEARDLFVRQAALTGEPFPVEKRPGDLDASAADLQAATNAAFMGASVLSGSGELLVCRTGRATCLGGIAASLGRAAAPTAFERGTRQFGRLLVTMTVALVVLIVAGHLLAHRPLGETVLFAVALAVGLTPELLPMVVSVTLARGAMRLSRRKVIVKRLAAIQDLGGMDVLCTDKTGTLTEGAIRLERHEDADGRESARVLELAVLNSRFESGLRSPLDDAILAHGEVDVSGWTKLDEVPFGFERRRVSVLVARGAERLIVVKGAPEDLLPLCREVEGADGRRAMDADASARALARFEALSRDGYRVLAIAWRAVGADHDHAVVDDESALVLAGYAAFLDPPKASAPDALRRLRDAGVRVTVLTGDNEWVTRHVCAAVGLPVAGLLTGAEVEALDDHALAAQAERTDVFCRVTPQQKHRILQALRRRGHVVGFLGDGINDAPALHGADVGLSVEGAVDVAKEAADLVLLERDLGVLHDGVLEGRRTTANVMKYVLMAASSNFGNMLSMAAASLYLPFLPMLPTQILLNNLLYDASEVAIPRDAVDPEVLAAPQGWDARSIRRFILTLGPVSSLFDVLTFALLLRLVGAAEAPFRTGWFLESIATQVFVIFVIRTRGAPWRSRPDGVLAATSVAVVVVAWLLPLTPLAGPLGFAPLPPGLLLAVAGMVVAYLGCAEAAKRWFHRRMAAGPAPPLAA